MGENFKKEIARDFLALGSWVFFLLVVGRILILPTRWPYLYHLISIGIFILILEMLVRNRIKIDYYVSRAVVLAYFTSIFYENFNYNLFVGFALLGLLVSSRYLGRDWKNGVFGLVGCSCLR